MTLCTGDKYIFSVRENRFQKNLLKSSTSANSLVFEERLLKWFGLSVIQSISQVDFLFFCSADVTSVECDSSAFCHKSVTHVTSEEVNDLLVWQIWIICRYLVSILLYVLCSSVWPWVRPGVEVGPSCTDSHGARARTLSSSSPAYCCAPQHICCAQHHIRDWELYQENKRLKRADIQRMSLKKNSVRKTNPASLY